MQHRASGVARRLLLAASVAVLPAGLSACALFAPIPSDRGQFVEKEDYNKLVPGTSTRSDVTQLMGSPTAKASFDENTWLYIGQITAPVPMSRPTVEKQQVLVLNFDGSGVLRAVRRLDQSDAVSVPMTARTTPTPGGEATFMQQLIGNVGRYNPLGALGGMGGADSLGGFGGNNGYGHGGTGNSLP